MKKTCFVCGLEKPLESFYRHPQMADGHLNKCIECAKSQALEHRSRNLEEVKQYDRNRPNHKQRIERNRLYLQTPAGRAAATKSKREWSERNKHKTKANEAVNNALRDGRLFKSKACSRCSLPGNLEAHHPDYSKPLDVLWVHDLCHKAIHKEEREARRLAQVVN